jgi:hypothetical protein
MFVCLLKPEYTPRVIDRLPTLGPEPKAIKLNQETSLLSQASDWLKWRLVALSANQMFEI